MKITFVEVEYGKNKYWRVRNEKGQYLMYLMSSDCYNNGKYQWHYYFTCIYPICVLWLPWSQLEIKEFNSLERAEKFMDNFVERSLSKKPNLSCRKVVKEY